MSRFTTVLFDLDGTLMQSDEGILNCVQYALAAYGYTAPPREQLRSFIGPPLPVEFARCTGCDTDRAEELTAKYRERYSVVGMFEAQPYPGVVDLLKRLRAAGIRTALATTKPQIFAERIAAHFDLTVDAVVGSELDGHRTDKKELIDAACAVLGVSDRSAVLMVGDRRFDMEGAIAAGVSSCGVTYGYGTAAELLAAGAQQLVDSADQLRLLIL